jgi:DNA-binding MarR family transcriptional regulator
MVAEGARARRAGDRADEAESVPPRKKGRTRLKPADLDSLIHSRMRLGIVSALAVNDSLSFTELKELLETSDGNVSVHTRRLEEAGYIDCTKSFSGRVPHTEYRLTLEGRRALDEYLNHLEAIIGRVREA